MKLRQSVSVLRRLVLGLTGLWIPVMADVPLEVTAAEAGIDLWSTIGAGALALIVLSRRVRPR